MYHRHTHTHALPPSLRRPPVLDAGLPREDRDASDCRLLRAKYGLPWLDACALDCPLHGECRIGGLQ